MRNMVLMVLNTLKVTFRKKGNIFVYLFLPLIGLFVSMLIYGGTGTSALRLGIADLDQSRLSTDFASALGAYDGYRVEPVNEKDVDDRLLDRDQDVVIIIPEGYEKSIYGGAPLKMDIVSIKGQDTTVWIENYINIYTKNLADISKAAGGEEAGFNELYLDYRNNPLKLTPMKLEDEKNGKMITVSSMGFLIMFVMLGVGFTSQFILNEKRTRTYYRICSAPVTPRSYIAANAVTSFIIMAVQTVIILLVMKFILHMKTYVPDLMMFVILMLFGLAAIGIGLVVIAFSSSSYMAGTLNSLILTPTCMLGGCLWPVWFMPATMQKIAFFVPQRWALDAIEKVQSGQSLGGIAINLAILLAFAAALFVIAIYRLSGKESVQRFV